MTEDRLPASVFEVQHAPASCARMQYESGEEEEPLLIGDRFKNLHLHRQISEDDDAHRLGKDQDGCRSEWTALDGELSPAAPASMVHELRKLGVLSGPLLFQNLCQYSISTIAIAFVGHLGDPGALSAAVLANSFFNVTGLSVIMGLAGGLETLCGQSYGARNYRMLGLYLQRALLICLLVSVPITCMWANVTCVLSRLGQPEDIVAAASRYLLLITPTLYMAVLTECLKRYLLAQRVVVPGMVVTGCTALLAPFAYWLFIFRLRLGLDGAAYAYNVCQGTSALGMVLYVSVRDYRLSGTPQQTFPPLSRAAFGGWLQYLRYGVPAAVMMCMEWWTYEVIIFMAGLLPTAQVAVGVMGLLFQILSTVYLVGLSIAQSVNTRVSNMLGAGRAAGARASFNCGTLSVATCQLGLALLTLAAGRHIVALFTSNPEDVAMTMRVLPVLVICFVGDGLNCVFQAVLRGAGRQGTGAALNIIGYWLIGVPAAAILGFRCRLDVLGFWLGIAIATSTQAVIQMTVICHFDWEVEVRRARALVHASHDPAVGLQPFVLATDVDVESGLSAAAAARKQKVVLLPSGSPRSRRTGTMFDMVGDTRYSLADAASTERQGLLLGVPSEATQLAYNLQHAASLTSPAPSADVSEELTISAVTDQDFVSPPPHWREH